MIEYISVKESSRNSRRRPRNGTSRRQCYDSDGNIRAVRENGRLQRQAAHGMRLGAHHPPAKPWASWNSTTAAALRDFRWSLRPISWRIQGNRQVNVGAAVVVTGVLLKTPEAKQPFEIHAASVELEGASTPDYPLQKKRLSLEYLHHRPPAPPHQHLQRGLPGALGGGLTLSTNSSRSAASSMRTPPHHRQRLREGAAEMFQVTTLDSTILPAPRTAGWIIPKDFFGKPHTSPPASWNSSRSHGLR